MKKICSKCKTEKSIKEFAFKSKIKNIKKPHCKECDKKSRKVYYEKNKDWIIKHINNNNIKNRKNNKKFVIEYLQKNSCINCGIKNPVVLDFDHKNPEEKIDSICRMVNTGVSLEKIKQEIEKCDIRCSNCHRIRTAKQFSWYKLELELSSYLSE